MGKANILKNEKQDMNDKSVFFASLVTNIPDKYDLVPYTRANDDNKGSKQIRRPKDDAGLSCSQFHDFDFTVFSVINPGRISNVKYFPNQNTGKPVVVYNVFDYKFCENNGRSHQRNNVYFVGNLHEKCVYQKCYKCVSFSGKRIPLVFDDSHNQDLISACEASEKPGLL